MHCATPKILHTYITPLHEPPLNHSAWLICYRNVTRLSHAVQLRALDCPRVAQGFLKEGELLLAGRM
jgi:hypothetical protein